jgi:membrane glycosyltransferase
LLSPETSAFRLSLRGVMSGYALGTGATELALAEDEGSLVDFARQDVGARLWRPAARRSSALPAANDVIDLTWPPRRPKAPTPQPYPALRSTPAAEPLAMPRQDLRQAVPAAPLATEPTALRRLVLIAGALAIAALVGAALFHVLQRNGMTVIEWATLTLSVLLSGWVGFGFVSASAGFVANLPRRGAVAAAAHTPIRARTAVLLPTYNEDPGLILAAAQSIAEEIGRLGLSDRFDFYVLSDTRDEEVARAEASGFVRLRLRLQDGPEVFYRRRAANTDRKAGNIGDWVETHGGAYDFMLVLDADSLMAGETIAALTRAMEADPRLGLLQTVPTVINAETPFARLQQFASRLYGPVFAHGQAWWSGSEGNYWGHNAMIRVAAFAASAGLPHLTGPRPFGGHIMSHDFIEAALMRRRGWAVRTVAGLPGSYEETPPTLLDTAARDRRWCQGNLQHARVLTTTGLHWVSRLHLACGIFAYLAPLLWLALLVCGAIVWPSQHLTVGSAEYAEVTAVFVFTLALLAAPKAMALGLAMSSPATRRGFGGAGRLTLGFVVECVASMLTTPVMMVMQAVAVFEVLLGRDSGWSAQRRSGVALSRRDAWRAHRGHVILGVAGGLGAFLVSKYFLMWASPVFLSLTLSALLSLHTSRPGSKGPVGRRILFGTPEDLDPPPVLARSLALRGAYAGEADGRRQVEALLRQPVPAYEFKHGRIARPPLGDELVDPGLGQRVAAAAQERPQVDHAPRRRIQVEHQPPAVLAFDGVGDWIDGLAEA